MKHSLLTATVLMLTATLITSIASEKRKQQQPRRSLQMFPQDLGGWEAEDTVRLSERVEEQLGATDYIVRTYRRGDRSVDLFIGYYADQRAGESMHSPRNCLPGAGWEISRFGAAEIPVGSDRVPVNEFEIQNGATRAVAMYWYQTPQRLYANEYMGKVMLVWDALAGRGTSGSIVRIVVPDDSHAADARAFASEVIPELSQGVYWN
jgi:EpsI family protein